MSYTNETAHYGIPLPLGSDLTTPMDYNESAQAIDTALFQAVTDASQSSQKASEVEQDLAETDERATLLTGRVTELEGTVRTQGGAIQQNSTRIEEVEDDALDMICAVDEGTAQVASVKVDEGEYFRYNNVLYIATANIAVGDTIVPNTNCRATNVANELKSISPSGEVIDITARQGVANNASHIGDLTGLQTTNKSDLVNAINEVLEMIGGGGMPTFDYANPLHTFSTGNLSFTATKECYLCGTIASYGSSPYEATVSINNTVVMQSVSNAVGSTGLNVVGNGLFKLKQGDVVVTNGAQPALHVFDIV